MLLLLVLPMLFLPFATASCSSPFGGRIAVNYSGWDSVVGTEPSVDGLDGLADAGAEDPAEAADRQEQSEDLRLLDNARAVAGLVFLAVLLVGVVFLLIVRSSKARSGAAAAVAAVAAGALLANHLLLRSLIRQAIDEAAADSRSLSEPDDLMPDIDIAQAFSVESRWGMGLSVGYLCLFAVLNGVWLGYRLRSGRSRPALGPN